MERGGLRHVATIQANSPTADTFGQMVPSWTAAHSNVRYEIFTLRGQELLAAQQINPLVSHKLRVPYRTGVTSEMRVLDGSRAFNILWTDNANNARNEWLDLYCTEAP